MSDIQTGSLKLISQELLDKLQEAFPGPQVSFDTDVEKIKWDAAQHAVVDWIISYTGKSQTIARPTQGDHISTGATIRFGQ